MARSQYGVDDMAIIPASTGLAHVSLHEAAAHARGLKGAGAATPGQAFRTPDPVPGASKTRSAPAARPAAPTRSTREYAPHTPVVSYSDSAPDRWDAMLNRLGQQYRVPPMFLKAVMLAESGGRPDAIGDNGHSVGLFQLHDQGYGHGMGDSRFDPEVNAERAVKGLSEAWHAGERSGLQGEQAVRAAYDYSFNPGGGWAYQGDGLVRIYNSLLAEHGQPPLS